MPRGAKLILGLLVLLAGPAVGLGGRVQASFALGQPAPERPKGSFGLEFELVLNGEQGEPASSSGAAVREEVPSVPEPEAPSWPHRPGKPRPVPGDLQPSGTSSGAGSPSSGAGVAAGSSFLPPLSAQVFGAAVSGRLFLANERLKPPPFPSRLFRPPRAV